MTEKLLKTKRQESAPQKRGGELPKKIVLVGTYTGTQLEDWPGYYNYPITKDDRVDEVDCRKVNEIWLFKGTMPPRYFLAKFIGVRTRDELKELGLSAKGHAQGDGSYLLFKISEVFVTETVRTRASGERVIVRTRDFARSPKVRKQLKAYLESPERNDPVLATQLPSVVMGLSRDVLRVCDSGVRSTLFSRSSPPSIVGCEKTTVKRYRIASLFAGCGGLDLGFLGGFDFLGKNFKRTAFDIVWANEWNPAACKTYARNIGPHIICSDIKDAIKDIPKNIDMIMGGFPCQDISINGKMLGINGTRSCLYRYIVEAVRRCHPKVFLAENVGSLLLRQNEYSFRKILADFESLDYNVTYKLYHAEEYGVPQTRERIVFIGTRKDLPPFTHPSPIPEKPITAGEALHDLEEHPQDREFSHIWSMAAASSEQGNRRMVENRPGYTIRAECHGNIQFHYKLPRRLSMREAARIQSFPDTFVFPCGIRETERQVGNAVPPVLAWHIANALQGYLEASK